VARDPRAACYEEEVSAGAEEQEDEPFARARRMLVGAATAIAAGLAIAGSVERTVGGVVVAVGWVLAVGALHRLGRAGSRRSDLAAKNDDPDAVP